jgi:hypothetical protein
MDQLFTKERLMCRIILPKFGLPLLLLNPFILPVFSVFHKVPFHAPAVISTRPMTSQRTTFCRRESNQWNLNISLWQMKEEIMPHLFLFVLEMRSLGARSAFLILV